MSRILYATWDGPGQNYLSTLFLPIFSALRPLGYEVSVLQHTWATSDFTDAEARVATRLGVDYTVHHLSPTFRKVALPLLIARGGWALRRHARALGARTILARSLIPAAMALVACRLSPELKLVFDADGLMADERVDFSGLSPRSFSYNFLRHIEADALRFASSVITRTERSRSVLAGRAGAGTAESKIFVVPNGKDASVFTPPSGEQVARTRREWGVPETAPWMIYVGSMGPQYHPDRMLQFAARVQAHAPEAQLHLFTLAEEAALELCRQSGIPNVHVAALPPELVPDALGAADLGVAFRTMSFSQAGVSPIKVAEYLLCGLPVVSTTAGDLDRQLAGSAAAFLLRDLSDGALSSAADWFVKDVLPRRQEAQEQARQLGLQWFSLDRCVQGYQSALRYADV